MANVGRKVLIYGGKGALGSVCVKYFKAANWWVGSIDLAENDDAHVNIIVHSCDTWSEQALQVVENVQKTLSNDKVDAILCVAGGWAGGNASHKDFISNSDLMWKQSVWTSSIAAQLAVHYLKEGGLLTFTGAQAALKGTPEMAGYGMAKAAVHQLVKSMAMKKSGLPDNAFVAAILPITLDTPMNRKWMPGANTSAWTPLETVAQLFHDWIENKGRPDNGSLIQLITKDNVTKFEPASL